ncbi:MAG: ferritin family protein [Polyangia bacterium]
MDIDQAIRNAISMENRIRDVYRSAAESAGTEVGSRIFGLLAAEEQNHVDYLKARLEEWERDGRLRAEDIETVIPPLERIEAEAAKLEKKLDGPDLTHEREGLQRAEQVERETSEFYERMVDELGDEGREFFGRFVEIEQGHLAIVQAELSAVDGMGYWFDMPEFDLEKA